MAASDSSVPSPSAPASKNSSKACKHWIRGPHRGLKRLHTSIHRSLRIRMVVSSILLGLAVAVVFSVVSMLSVRTTMTDQAASRAQKDFAETVTTAQKSLESADITSESQTQRLVVDLASQLQSQGASNLVSVSMRPQNPLSSSIVPVSTDSSSLGTISETMENRMATSPIGTVFYQPTQIPAVFTLSDRGAPGAVLATVLRFPGGDEVGLFSLYSFADSQRSLEGIQRMLFITCVILSLSMGLLGWILLRSVIRPVQKVAGAAESLAAGDLDARVSVNRSDEIGVLQRSFNAMADTVDSQIAQLEAAGRAQQRFVSDVSHELRTPVTTIRMASDLLAERKETFDPTTKRTVELLSGQTTRFEEMLAELLEISRYDARHATFVPQTADLRDPLLLACETVAEIARSKEVLVRTHLPDVPVIACFDHGRVTGIVRNLLSNAIDFSDGTPIDLTLIDGTSSASIIVRDRGTGIEAEQLDHIFDRFWRADPSRSRLTGGTGLGLSIVRQNVELHHGAIDVRSLPHEGTCFIVTLPHEPSEFAEHSEPAELTELTKSTKPSGMTQSAAKATKTMAVSAPDEMPALHPPIAFASPASLTAVITAAAVVTTTSTSMVTSSGTATDAATVVASATTSRRGL